MSIATRIITAAPNASTSARIAARARLPPPAFSPPAGAGGGGGGAGCGLGWSAGIRLLLLGDRKVGGTLSNAPAVLADLDRDLSGTVGSADRDPAFGQSRKRLRRRMAVGIA